MKRSDDNRISQIKIPDAAVAIAAAAAQNSTNTGAGTIATPIFSQRQLVDMPQQPINATSGTGATGVPGVGMSQVTLSNTVSQPTSGGGQQQVSIATAAQLSSTGGQLPVGAANAVPIQGATFQRIQSSSTSGHASVSVFRSDGSVSVQPTSVTSQQQPPQAHSNIAMTPTPARSSTQPAPPAHITQTPVTQPAGNIKPEPIALPTTPVSVQYTTTTFPGAGHAPPGSVHPPTIVPPSVKTLATGQGASSTQNIVNLTSQASITAQPAHQQIIHQKGAHGVTFGPPSGIRTITTGNLAAAGNVSSSSIVGGTPATPAGGNGSIGNGPQGNAQFQRLKVEDALSYLDQVKFKFGNQPQVYNDFLDIMKEFKTQSIDTPGVIARVSCLFKGHPELIVGFNTFLPPGYKIEVTSMNTVGVTGIPGTTGMQTIVHTPHGIHTMGAQGNMSVISTPSSETLTGSISVTTGSTQQPHQPQVTRQTTAIPSLTSGLPINNKYQGPAQQQTQAAHQHQNIIKTDSSVLPNNTSQPANNQFPASHQINQSSNHPAALTVTHHPAQRGEHVTVLSSGSATNIQQHTLNLTQPSSNQITSHQLPPTAHHPIPSHISNLSQGPPLHGGNSQPEFNHAINYVNKIKNRFQGQPDVYKQFLEILHTYQKDQKAIKEGNPPVGRHLTETEVYAQVSKLFQNQEDLLNEFGQFLPEATNDHATSVVKTGLTNDHISVTKKPAAVASTYKYPKYPATSQNLGNSANNISGMGTLGTKRPPSGITQPPPKKPKFPGSLRDVSLAEAGKFGTLNEYAFFDKVRKALRSPEVYENFLRCLVLFNQEVISRTELVQLTSTFLNRYPELFKWFKDFVGYKDGPQQNTSTNEMGRSSLAEPGISELRTAGTSGVPSIRASDRGMSGEKAMEIDYATCKRLGKSYCAYPKDFRQPVCTGRTELCRQVLNDNWVSFPTWSEDSQFVTQRKTQFEEFVYRTEDERFEFDIVLETNKDTIKDTTNLASRRKFRIKAMKKFGDEELLCKTEDERFELDIIMETNLSTLKVLECVQKKMSRMPPEEAARYRLDDCLGGTSQTIHQRAIRRIYGDKSVDIIEGLKRNPVVAVPLVLRRLRAKDEEWREVQKNFNKVWRDQNEKHYLKSLDHQCMQFKQSDTRNLRSKSLLNEIETLYDERHEQEEAINNAVNGERQNIVPEGPHMTIEYQDPSILDDVNNLLIHHVKRQTSIHKEDKQKIKLLLRHFLMDTFKHPRQDLSEDEREDEEDSSNKEDNESDTGNNVTGNLAHVGSNNGNISNINANSSVNTNALANRDSGATTKATRSERARKKKEEKREKDKQSEEKSKKEKDEKCIKEDITETDIKLEYRDGRKTPLHARDMEPDESYMHMICNNNWYLFYRLHHILCERLTKMYNQAVIIANEESKDKKDRKECTAVALRLKPKNEIEPEDYYPAFIDMVKNLLDGNMDAQSYEDTLREMFGIHAYISFTLDKVVGNAVRQLQHLVTDEAAIECYDMFLAESKNKATGGFCSQAHERQIAEMIYQKKLEKLLADENCMKIFVYHQSCKLTIEMLDTETDGQNSDDEKDETARKYASYVDRFIQPDESVSIECKEHLTAKPVFLPRSVRSYNLSPYGKARSAEAQEINNSDELENHADVKHNSCTTVKDPLEKEKSNKDKESLTSQPPISSDGVYNTENTQVTFNPKNFKILYVINSENCFYRKLALTRAKHSHKAVSRRKTSDFNRWHSKWVKEHVSDVQESNINEWFMGKSDGLVNNKTHKITKSDQDRTPYRTFYKFKAEIIKE